MQYIIPISIEALLFGHMMHILQMLSSHLLRGAHFFAHCTTPRRGEALN